MTFVTVCSRTGVKCTRVKIDHVDFNGPVSGLKIKTARTLDLPVQEFDMIYAGKQLKDGEVLHRYGLKPGVTIHVLKKTTHADLEEQVPERMDRSMVQQVVTALQSALMNPAYRSIVEKMVSNPDMLENLIAATPGLDKDPVARAMLQDPELLAILADPDNIRKVIESHPCMGQAAMLVAAAVNEEGAKAGSNRSRSARGTYSLDQMSDDEDDPRPQASTSRQPAHQPITASQLAAALSAAAGGSASARPEGGGQGSASQTQHRPQLIDTEFLQHAMQAAARESGATSSQQQPQPPAVTESQLQQLREMGITDEVVARQALEASGGNIQSALEIIFGESSLPQ